MDIFRSSCRGTGAGAGAGPGAYAGVVGAYAGAGARIGTCDCVCIGRVVVPFGMYVL